MILNPITGPPPDPTVADWPVVGKQVYAAWQAAATNLPAFVETNNASFKDVGRHGEWQTNLYGQVGSPEQQPELGLHFWWYEFDDPVLNEQIETARRENPALCIAGLVARHTTAECRKSFSLRRKLCEVRHS